MMSSMAASVTCQAVTLHVAIISYQDRGRLKRLSDGVAVAQSILAMIGAPVDYCPTGGKGGNEGGGVSTTSCSGVAS